MDVHQIRSVPLCGRLASIVNCDKHSGNQFKAFDSARGKIPILPGLKSVFLQAYMTAGCPSHSAHLAPSAQAELSSACGQGL